LKYGSYFVLDSSVI